MRETARITAEIEASDLCEVPTGMLRDALRDRGVRFSEEVGVEEFDTTDLRKELQSRGQMYREQDFEEAVVRFRRSDTRECLFQLERAVPELSGLGDRVGLGQV